MSGTWGHADIYVVVEQDQHGDKILLAYRHNYEDAKILSAEYKRTSDKKDHFYFAEAVSYEGKKLTNA